MTNEEAIEILRKNRPTIDPRPCGMGLCDAVDMAISALRQQEHFREVTKKVEPLTLNELRKMDNQPVWIEDVGEYKWHGSGWAIVDREYCLVRKASNGNPAFFERYGKEWIAYRQQPAENFGQKCCPDQKEGDY